MLCGGCGFLNIDGARFCAACGMQLQRRRDFGVGAALSGVCCQECGSLNKEDSAYCVSCGAVLHAAAVAAGSNLPDASPSVPNFAPSGRHDIFPVDPGIVINPLDDEILRRRESIISNLDKLDSELEARRRESTASLADDSRPEERADALSALSTTLDSLIADLLDVEIKEYSVPDFIHPDESGFPPRNPAAYKPRRKPAKNLSFQEILLVIALTAAIFLVGMSCGLWSSYFFGF